MPWFQGFPSRYSWRVHVGKDNGDWLKPAMGHKIVNLSYARAATSSDYHIAFQVREKADIEGTSKAIKVLMNAIEETELIHTHRISVRHARGRR